MEKIDRLGWAAGFSFSAYGVRVGVRVNDAAAVSRLFKLLPPGWRFSRAAAVERLYSLAVGDACARPGVRRYNILYGGVERLARTLELDEALDALESDLKLYVAESARRRVFVHAGVVGWRGRAILIPGRSFSGKTTLVAELVRAGADYYSDEYAVLDEKGHVHPYPRPLSVRREGEPGAREKISAGELGGREGDRPLGVRLVVFSRYEPGARWRPRSLSPGRGTLELLGHTVPARRRPASALAALSLAARGARVLKGARGEAEESAALILRAAERIT